MDLLNAQEIKVVNECNQKCPALSQFILSIKQLKHWEDACGECYQHVMDMFIRIFTEIRSDRFISVNDDFEVLTSDLKRTFSIFKMLAGNDQNLCNARDHILLGLSAGQKILKLEVDQHSQEEIAWYVEIAREMRELQQAFVQEVIKIIDVLKALESISARVDLALHHSDLLESLLPRCVGVR
jgi:hypothetical protein